jgi:uncharacterized protein YozE (UPF0346 family)
MFFFNFLDKLSPPETRNRAADAALFHLIYATASLPEMSDNFVVISL